MKHSLYVFISLLLLTMLTWSTGCTTKNKQGEDSVTDSIIEDTVETDSLESLIEEAPMPKAADELFDDFVFNFAAKKKLQRERIEFPLQVDNFGTKSTIAMGNWKMEHFFMRQGFYALVVDNPKTVALAKDTAISHVIIEKVLFDENAVQQYVFNRVNGLWKMQQIRKEKMEQNVNGAFYSFYNKFANDSTFQANSLAESVQFSGPDPEDDFSRIDGSIMPEQWYMFAPRMPQGTLFNIIYGNGKISGSKRTIIFRGIANGMEMEMTFKKTANGYELIKLTT